MAKFFRTKIILGKDADIYFIDMLDERICFPKSIPKL
jgi:hypothetical protein